MSNAAKLKEILEKNPVAQSQAEMIAEALDLVRQIRKYGRGPHSYGLEGPFGDRSWLRKPALGTNARSRKLTEYA